MAYRIFISYSQEDFRKNGRKIFNYLCHIFSSDSVYIDQSKPKGKQWREENDKKLRDSDLVVLIITPSALISQEVKREIKIAKDMQKCIFPCKHNSINKRWEDLPFDLGSIEGISFDDEEDLMLQLAGEIPKIKEEFTPKTSYTETKFVTVKTDKDAYSDGETIAITGEVKELLSGYPVSIQIISSKGHVIRVEQLDVTQDKKFSLKITAGGQLWEAVGTYTIKVFYGIESRNAEASFEFSGSSKIISPISSTSAFVEGTPFTIDYHIDGGKILSVVKNTGTSSLIIALESYSDGVLSITLPRELLDAKKNEDQDDVFIVLKDGVEIKYDETTTSTNRTLSVLFEKGTTEIEIIGTPSRESLMQISKPKQTPVSSSSSNHVISLSVASDRTVYPLHSKIYLQASLNDVILGKMIEFEIYNYRNESIFSKKIDPRKHKPTSKGSGIYEISLLMKSKKWKLGETYTVRAKHGSAEAFDSFIIDERTPVIQTDKSVYLWGSDMIVTVIDPDADKDARKVEFVGNRKDSKLIISSSQGTINGYKLRETGTSTGIFQGLIGIIGASGRKTVCGYKLGRKIITKNQGKGIDDGFLKVERGGEIILEYKNKSKKVKLTAFTSNFGATIELDQKVYTWTDKIYITVVAPAYNFNRKKPDVIGGSNESKITISTSKGRLSGYKLIETGKDTGIFTGEITLTGFKSEQLTNNKKFGITRGKGPTNGLLAASNDDLLEVKFNYFGLETITGRAKISWNIGEIQWLKQEYSTGDKGTIRVIDPDMNLNPDKIDKFKVHVSSDSDPTGIDVFVYETDVASGIFEGFVTFNEYTSTKTELKVSRNDSVYAKYVDRTLPTSINDSSEIVAKTTIV